MDALISASARSLAHGDPLGALRHVALRDDPAALALRGIAMAQLEDLPLARQLLRRAARGFGAHEAHSRARCIVAEAEVALAMRDLGGSPRSLAAAATALAARGDHGNAVHARLIAVRRQLLMGRLADAEAALADLGADRLPPPLAAVAHLSLAELALRSLRTGAAQAAIARAQAAAERARIPALVAEVAGLRASLDRPAARRLSGNGEEALRLAEVESLLASGDVILDACRRGVRAGDLWRPLARRPVLFALARALAQAWPGDVGRDELIATAFRLRRPDETHRARLRVELGRLRALVAGIARIEATGRGFALRVQDGRAVVVLAPPIEGEQASLLALLADGAAWSTSALALALDASQRTVQRALGDLVATGRVRSIGMTRNRRWLASPLAGFTTILLLPAALPLE
jgi:hypothetical protein